MKSFLLVLAFSFSALGANLQARWSKFSGKDKCPSAYEVASSTIAVNGHTIQRTSFACPDGSLTKTTPSTGKAIPSSAFEKRSTLEARNAAECRTAAPECQCGTSFLCTCQNVTATAPNSGDCTILIDSTQVIAQTAGQTFIVQPNSFELITFQTCALEFTNFASTPLEYCWDELGSTGGVVNQVCFEKNAGTAVACNANDNLWLVQSLRVSS